MRVRQAGWIREQLRNLPDLPGHLDDLLRQIPPGRVTTHGTLADHLGNRVASRWVGHYVLHHDHKSDCPCHRVVRADGSLGGYVSGHADEKLMRLRSETVPCRERRVDLRTHGFSAFESTAPLQQLERLQQEMRGHGRQSGSMSQPRTIGGVDVSYRSPWGFATYVEVDPLTREVSLSVTVQQIVTFPYISSYLAFRELPVLLELLQQVRAEGRLADVLVVDGAGIAHPRRMGLAAMLGIAAEIPTIGVTKKLLYGRVDLAHLRFGEERKIRDEQGQPLGAALLPWKRTRKPIYVSPGNQIDVEQAVQLVQQLLGHHRLPEPIYWADRLSRRAARAGTPTP